MPGSDVHPLIQCARQTAMSLDVDRVYMVKSMDDIPAMGTGNGRPARAAPQARLGRVQAADGSRPRREGPLEAVAAAQSWRDHRGD